jgi:hypothetical protein
MACVLLKPVCDKNLEASSLVFKIFMERGQFVIQALASGRENVA